MKVIPAFLAIISMSLASMWVFADEAPIASEGELPMVSMEPVSDCSQDSVCPQAAIDPNAPRLACATDSLFLEGLLRKRDWSSGNRGVRIAAMAEGLAGIPEASVPQLMRDTTGAVSLDFSSLDPLEFIFTVLGTERAFSRNRSDWATVCEEYARFGRRNGEASGFSSRFLFPSDWIADNLYRNTIQEISGSLGQDLHQKEKTVDRLLRSRDDYAALADSARWEEARNRTMGFVDHRINQLPVNCFNKNEVRSGLRDGDIVVLYSTERDLDSTDLGIVKMKAGLPYLIHVSPSEGKIVVEAKPLDRYCQTNIRRISGVRIFRANP